MHPFLILQDSRPGGRLPHCPSGMKIPPPTLPIAAARSSSVVQAILFTTGGQNTDFPSTKHVTVEDKEQEAEPFLIVPAFKRHLHAPGDLSHFQLATVVQFLPKM